MRTIKAIPPVLFALFILSVTQSKAQSIPKNTFKLDVGADALAPIGYWQKYYNFGTGGTVRLNYGISNNTALTLTTGYYRFFGNDETRGINMEKLSFVPLRAGVKTFVTSHIYLNADAGVGFTGGWQRKTKATFSGGVGWTSGGLDIGAKFENFSGQQNGFNTVGLRVAYGFKL